MSKKTKRNTIQPGDMQYVVDFKSKYAIEVLEYLAVLCADDDPELSRSATVKALQLTGKTGDMEIRKKHMQAYRESNALDLIGRTIKLAVDRPITTTWTIHDVDIAGAILTRKGYVGTRHVSFEDLKKYAIFVPSGDPVAVVTSGAVKIKCSSCGSGDTTVVTGRLSRCACGTVVQPCHTCDNNECRIDDMGHCMECPEHNLVRLDIEVTANFGKPHTEAVKILSSTHTIGFDSGVSKLLRDLKQDFEIGVSKIIHRRTHDDDNH